MLQVGPSPSWDGINNDIQQLNRTQLSASAFFCQLHYKCLITGDIWHRGYLAPASSISLLSHNAIGS